MLIKLIPYILLPISCLCQEIDTSQYIITAETTESLHTFFTKDSLWRGADGAASIDLENGKVLWLFSDSFICLDSSQSRKKSVFIRNSIAIQEGYNLNNASVKFYWDKSKKKPRAFFHLPGKYWFWTGHGTMIKDKLIIFLIKEKAIKTGLGFEAAGWYMVLISNPHDDPSKWQIQYIEGPETYGYIAGSAAVLKDEQYLYAFGAVEPATHEVYALRWKIDDAYSGNIKNPEWCINGEWINRKTKYPIPEPLFIGATEYSVHFDKTIQKYIQIQSYGFGEAQIGIRMADSLEGTWTEPYLFNKPTYPGVKQPFMYSVKAHPELSGNGVYITYNVNSFDLSELIENQTIYFPKFVLLKLNPTKPY